MTKIKEELHKVVDLLDNEDAKNWLNLLRRFVFTYDTEMLTEEEEEGIKIGESEIRNGDFITLEEYKNKRKLY